MKKENAINILKSRKMISKEGKYTLKVTSVTPFHRSNEQGSDQVAIANFNGMAPYHVEAAQTLFAQGDYQEAVNQNLSASIRETDYLPSKGEVVDVIVEQITTNNGVTGLFVTSVIPKKAETAPSLNILSFLEESGESVNILENVKEEKKIPAFAEEDLED